MLQADGLVSLIDDLEHFDTLYADGHHRHDDLSSVETKRRIFALALNSNFRLLVVDSFFRIEDHQRNIIGIEMLL